MRYLTIEEVLEINAEVMGGRHALRDRGLLDSAVARPQASAFGADAYLDLASKAAALLHSLVLNHAFVDGNKRTAVLATLVDLASKAAALLHSLVLNHAFVDGNKRTAVLATLVFLDLNGYVIRWDQQEALDFVLSLVVRQIELDDVKTFLRSRMYSKDIVAPHKPEET
ncbi:MAG: type II toxin-antitoxin system death-on-curing family toxin [Deltaproteobacteria bacterium]|nr:type II toxin-antitoxin system death-on-curing family toxin [Deltaproteobacteria bacterium]